MQFIFLDMQFDTESGQITTPDKIIELRRKTADLLYFLLKNHQRVISKDELIDALWPDTIASDSNLVQSIQELRKALKDNAREPKFIQTFPKRGYQWIAFVENDGKIKTKQKSFIKMNRFRLISLLFACAIIFYIYHILNQQNASIIKIHKEIQTGEYAVAKAHLEDLIENEPNNDQLNLMLSLVYYNTGKWDKAVEVVKINKKSKNIKETIQCSILLAKIFQHQGKLIQSKALFQHVFDLSMQHQMIEFAYSSALQLLDINSFLNISNRSLQDKIIQLPKPIEQENYQIMKYFYGALDKKDQNGMDPNEQIQLVINHYRKIGDKQNEVMALMVMAMRKHIPKLQKIKLLENAYSLSLSMNHIPNQTLLLNKLGQAYIQNKQYKIAINYLNKANELNNKLGAMFNQALDLFYLGQAYLALSIVDSLKNDFYIEQAQIFFENSIGLYKKTDGVSMLPLAHLSLALTISSANPNMAIDFSNQYSNDPQWSLAALILKSRILMKKNAADSIRILQQNNAPFPFIKYVISREMGYALFFAGKRQEALQKFGDLHDDYPGFWTSEDQNWFIFLKSSKKHHPKQSHLLQTLLISNDL